MRVLNFGSMNVDYVYKVDHFVRKGETLLSESRNTFSGGKGLNQSIALSRAGLNVYHAGCLGTGGDLLLDVLRNDSVNTDYIRLLSDVPCGHTIIQNDREGDNCILLFGGSNQCVTEEQVDETLSHFGPEDWIILQNELNDIAYIMEKAYERGMKIALNPSPINEAIRDLPFRYVDLLFVNEIEAGAIAGLTTRDADPLLDVLEKKYPDACLVLTLGGDGSVCSLKGQRIRQPIYKVDAVDTTAAGDTFSGYFLAGIIEGKTPAEALDLAAKAAAIAVTRPGAAPSIPTRKEVEESLLTL